MLQIFYYKMQQKFNAKCVRFFVAKCFIVILTVTKKDEDFITQWDSYQKMRRFYYTMRQLLKIAKILLHNATVIKKCEDFITHCDSY